MYLDLEFCDIKHTLYLNFDYNLMLVSNDFILLISLVGNDFLPNPPKTLLTCMSVGLR